MATFSAQTFLTQGDKSTKRLKELQQAIEDNTQKLEEVQQRTLLAEEEIIQCTRETERRVDLMKEKSDVVDVLQHLGHLLKEERHLSEQLNDQSSANGNQKSDLQEMSECMTDKVRSLTAEILEVKKLLAEAKTHNMAAQALIKPPTSKPKRNQR